MIIKKVPFDVSPGSYLLFSLRAWICVHFRFFVLFFIFFKILPSPPQTSVLSQFSRLYFPYFINSQEKSINYPCTI